MAKKLQDDPEQVFQQKEAERHVKEMLGPAPEETNKLPDFKATPGAVVSPSGEQLHDLKPKWAKIKRLLKAWWHNPKARWATIIIVILAILGVGILPSSRYFVLNNVGVRSSASLTVLDESTQLPLRNVKVKLGNSSAVTTADGKVKLSHIKLGNSTLVIEKRAFATINRPLTVGWGSNPLGNFTIQPVGVQFAFIVNDWLTGQPIAKAEATSGDANAISDTKGKVLLTIDTSEVQDNMTVNINADGYRTEKVQLDTSSKSSQTVILVPSRKEAFISNRDGKYSLYSIDIDGKNEKLVLVGNGLEREAIQLVPHPADELVALVSSRINIRNADGYLLDTLSLVNLDGSAPTTVAQSERIQIVGWVGTKLLYVQIAAGASGTNPNRFKLISYDYKTQAKVELDSANSFNDVILVNSSIYWAPSSAFQKDNAAGLFKANADGSGKSTLLAQEVNNIFRDSYDTLDLAVGGDWYQYKLGNSNAIKQNETPPNPSSRIYINNSDNSQSVWIDQRDGKGVLLNYNPNSSASDKVLQTQDGLIYPVRWLSDSVVIFRIHTPKETSDNVISINGGTSHKIKDVYNTTGIDRWYFY